MPESQELIDISGDKMRLVAAFPSPPEPHDAVMVNRRFWKTMSSKPTKPALRP